MLTAALDRVASQRRKQSASSSSSSGEASDDGEVKKEEEGGEDDADGQETKKNKKNKKGKAGDDASAGVRSQPAVGSKSGAKGRVEWKWGGMVCSGVLLPSKETSTHCYAKTHKGNVKTLAKGKDYWAVVVG